MPYPVHCCCPLQYGKKPSYYLPRKEGLLGGYKDKAFAKMVKA